MDNDFDDALLLLYFISPHDSLLFLYFIRGYRQNFCCLIEPPCDLFLLFLVYSPGNKHGILIGIWLVAARIFVQCFPLITQSYIRQINHIVIQVSLIALLIRRNTILYISMYFQYCIWWSLLYIKGIYKLTCWCSIVINRKIYLPAYHLLYRARRRMYHSMIFFAQEDIWSIKIYVFPKIHLYTTEYQPTTI